MKSKLDCACNGTGSLGLNWNDKTIWCHECNWETTCQNESCESDELGADGYCYDCEFERSIDKAEALYDAWKEEH